MPTTPKTLKLRRIRHRRRVARTLRGRPTDQAAMIAAALRGYRPDIAADQRRDTVTPGPSSVTR